MGRTKLKSVYLIEYKNEIGLLSEGLSLSRVRSKTCSAINTLRKLQALFHL